MSPCFEVAGVAQEDFAVDLGRVGLRAAGGAASRRPTSSMITSSVRPILACELGGADRGGLFHDPGVALFLDLFGHRVGQRVGGGALDRLEAERADAVELGFVEPVEQILEILLGLAGEADDEARADRDVGRDLAPALAAARAPWPRWPGGFIARSTAGAGVLERDVEIGEQQPLGHQRDDLVDVRVGVDIVEPHPRARSCPSSRARSVMWGRTSRPFHIRGSLRMSTP